MAAFGRASACSRPRAGPFGPSARGLRVAGSGLYSVPSYRMWTGGSAPGGGSLAATPRGTECETPVAGPGARGRSLSRAKWDRLCKPVHIPSARAHGRGTCARRPLFARPVGHPTPPRETRHPKWDQLCKPADIPSARAHVRGTCARRPLFARPLGHPRGTRRTRGIYAGQFLQSKGQVWAGFSKKDAGNMRVSCRAMPHAALDFPNRCGQMRAFSAILPRPVNSANLRDAGGGSGLFVVQ
jgi:hypothetical protein